MNVDWIKRFALSIRIAQITAIVMIVKYKTIKEWAEEDRPREKLLKHGSTMLTNSELLAIVLGSGNQRQTALDLAKNILAKAGSLRELYKKKPGFYLQFNGVGEAKAVNIIAALELGKRRQMEEAPGNAIIKSSADVYKQVAPMLEDLTCEEFWILSLDRKNEIISKDIIGKGGMHQVVVDPKVVYNTALTNRAAHIILIHNHPSGQVNPSDQDKAITHKLAEAGRLLDIPVVDHLIIGRDRYYSFADSSPSYLHIGKE